MQVASTSYRAYAIDLWGFGDTAHNTSNYSLDHQALLIDRFLEEMGIGKVAIVGHGFGALVGMNFAVNFSHSVDRVMAISCPVNYESVNTRFQTSSAPDLAGWLLNGTPEAAAVLADASKSDHQAVAASLARLQTENIYDSFRALSIPSLLVYGENDQAITIPDESMSTSTMIHQITLEESGHFPMLDEAMVFNRLLTDFLALDSGASPAELQLKEEWKRRVR